ncbi:lariat debranching enzyme, C-terminal domain-containing protein [Aspergillus egyptiacus]|nr:lariat debranching enzyme, C-terminal domain-containing protein [Aspergillus egyptiacus]
MSTSSLNSASIRVAVEGCGHGCLHDIYASVEKAAALKGWDGVDLLIIGGDFQSVRNSNDMACMSVPAKYKEIGDFHEYYSGKRTAPYLTIFIGGNHEASNYLFELYYGGWVAPNIYYMGAANVLRCGPLRIAALSGIWKGYDYQKPHYERIPYNYEDIHGIYHVRELDVRKLLQIRTQVDVGLSHDWPRKVEYSGNWQELFRTKPFLSQDSQNGRLGSEAARYVLDRLRPAYWFSAHLHVKFAASVQHLTPSNVPKHHFGLDGATVTSMASALLDEDDEVVQPANVFKPNEPAPARNEQEQQEQVESATTVAATQIRDENTLIGTAQEPQDTGTAPVETKAENTGDKLSAWKNFHEVAAKNEAAEISRYFLEQANNTGSSTLDVQHNLTWYKVEVDEDGRRRAGTERSGNSEPREAKKQKVQHEQQAVKNADEIDLDLDGDSDQEQTVQPVIPKTVAEAPASKDPHTPHTQSNASDVSEEIRKQLPSSFAAPKADPPVVPVKGPFPEEIFNTTTNFLALDKCLKNREFLQLLEIPIISDTSEAQLNRPFRLQYDKEWLAITRVFANDLHLGDPSARSSPDRGDAFYKPLIKEEEKWIEENVIKPGKIAVPENFTLTAPVYDPSVPVTTDQQPPEYNNPQTAAFCELVGIENKFYLTDEEREARMAAGPRPCARPNPEMNRRGRGRFGFGGRGGGGRGRGRGFGRGGYSRGGRR